MSDHANRNSTEANCVIDVSGVCTRFGTHVVHKDLDLQVMRAEVLAVVGGSGSGKSTLLREMILLQRPDAGRIRVLGVDLKDISRDDALALRRRWGVMFQHGGLFGALTVLENIGLPLRERARQSKAAADKLDDAAVDGIARDKLALAGLAAEVGAQYPSELSGGMMKRASLARALVLEPELLFLDEPTAGLDPSNAGGVDTLVRSLRDEFGLSIVMVTHDLDLLWGVADRVAVLARGKVRGLGSMQALSGRDDADTQPYFQGPRASHAQARHTGAAASTPR